MYEASIIVRNTLLGWLYRHILRPVFFRYDPERVHNWMVENGDRLGKNGVTNQWTGWLFNYRHPSLTQTVQNLQFVNPIGLSAGFDKQGVLTKIIPSVGFGFMEVGSITAEASPGNPKPRLWRYPEEKSLLVHLGLNSEGVDVVAKRFEQQALAVGRLAPFPVGTNIAMTNKPDSFGVDEGIVDYATSFQRLSNIGAYFTINISCPNTYQGQPFSDPAVLDELFTVLDSIPTSKPVFLKLSPDLSEHNVDALLEVVRTHRLQGFVCSNLTQKHSKEHPGGLSGKVQEHLSDAQLRHVFQRTGDAYTLIGVGGVFSAEDAYKKIRLGASLVELITGMIYEGPQLISAINQGLVRLLKKDGFPSIGQAVGTGLKGRP